MATRTDFRTAVLVVAIATTSAIGCGKKADAKADAAKAARPVSVVAVPVVKKDVPIFLDGLGSVTAYKTVLVKTQVDGVLESMDFREGDPVKRGQVIAQIDPRPFVAALHSVEGALARDQAQLDNGRLNMKRYQDLLAKKLIPEQQLTDQQALVGQLEGTVLLDKAAIETAKLNLDYASIKSPVDGVTGVRVVDPGNVVHAADPNGLVIITQLDPIAVIFTLPQDYLPDIATQMEKNELVVAAYSRAGQTSTQVGTPPETPKDPNAVSNVDPPLATGKLLLIDNQINASTGTLRLKAIFPNSHHVLWPNQFVKASLNVTTRKDALVVPATAVQRGPDGPFAWVVAKDSTVSAKLVTVERNIGDAVLIAQGLIEGEQVVTEGQTQLRAGSKVATRDPNAPVAAGPASTTGASAATGPLGPRGIGGQKQARKGGEGAGPAGESAPVQRPQ